MGENERMGNIEHDLAAERIAALEWAVEYWRAEAEAAHRRTAKWQEKVGDARRELRRAVEERDALRAAIQPFLELDYDLGGEWAEACEAARAAHANSYRFTAVEVAEIEVEAGERAEVFRAADPDAPPNKQAEREDR